MCSSHNQSCIESKRAYHYIMPSSSSQQQTIASTNNITCVPQRKKMKTDRPVPRRVSIESAVHFSSTVSMRSFYYDDDKLQLGNSSSSSWLQKEEIDAIKSQAKTLAKVHRCLRKSSLSKAEAEAFAKISPTRYEIQGESLRGLEHITSNGRNRHALARSAMNAAIREQNTQFLEYIHDNNVMSSSDLTYVDGDGVDQIKRHAMKIDTYRLSKVYGKKTKQSLSYAQRVAAEDAKIAASILAQDLAASISRSDDAMVL